jgi:hypothetical protein
VEDQHLTGPQRHGRDGFREAPIDAEAGVEVAGAEQPALFQSFEAGAQDELSWFHDWIPAEDAAPIGTVARAVKPLRVGGVAAEEFGDFPRDAEHVLLLSRCALAA